MEVLYRLSYRGLRDLLLVVGEGFEPSKAEPPDLQSGPFDRSGTPPSPDAYKRRQAGDGIRTRDPQLGRLMLYQLSYSRVIVESSPPLRQSSWRWDSNPQPAAYKAAALPIELRQHARFFEHAHIVKDPPISRGNRRWGGSDTYHPLTCQALRTGLMSILFRARFGVRRSAFGNVCGTSAARGRL